MEIRKPRGTQDVIGDSLDRKLEVIKIFSTLCNSFGFKQITTPIFEQKSLFVRSVGESTDIVEKELFELENKSDEIYALRPELTAGIVRAQNEMGTKGQPLPILLYSIGDIFRYDKPQKGRYRQSSQLDAEILGLGDPIVDIFLINSVNLFFKKIGTKNKLIFNVNTLGSTQTKIDYTKKLVGYLKNNLEYLCEDCQRRIEKNPLRILDCKVDQCKKIALEGPSIYDSLTDEENLYFKQVIEGLEELQIPFNVDQTMVRGLDYYTGLIFEVNLAEDKQRKISLGGGGRYDNLTSELGGESLPACGYAIGIERVCEFMDFEFDNKIKKRVIIVATSEKQRFNILKIQNELLYTDKIELYAYLKNSSLSESLSFANKNSFDMAIIAADEESTEGKYILKNLKEATQKVLTITEIKKELELNS